MHDIRDGPLSFLVPTAITIVGASLNYIVNGRFQIGTDDFNRGVPSSWCPPERPAGQHAPPPQKQVVGEQQPPSSKQVVGEQQPSHASSVSEIRRLQEEFAKARYANARAEWAALQTNLDLPPTFDTLNEAGVSFPQFFTDPISPELAEYRIKKHNDAYKAFDETKKALKVAQDDLEQAQESNKLLIPKARL